MNQKRLRSLYDALRRLLRDNHFPRAAAGLSYFLLMTLFPLLICLYQMLGGLFPAPAEIREFFSGILPPETVETVLDFLRYVAEHHSSAMFVLALTVVVTAAASAYRIIDDVIDELRRVRRRRRLADYLASFLMSLLFLASVYAAAMLVLTGRWFLNLLDRSIMFMNISDVWRYLRYPLLLGLIFGLFCGVYRMTAPRGAAGLRIVPGAAAGALSLLLVSMVFSHFLSESVKYPLLYGSIASVILMMLWLYLCGIVLFLGAAVNVALERTAYRKRRVKRIAEVKEA